MDWAQIGVIVLSVERIASKVIDFFSEEKKARRAAKKAAKRSPSLLEATQAGPFKTHPSKGKK